MGFFLFDTVATSSHQGQDQSRIVKLRDAILKGSLLPGLKMESPEDRQGVF